ncbi:MAG: SGNH/GDSL hydrolase family protein, partial [Kiritimatiellae bacterium]|nr:SGNH/GDSL hydrolase family protein [Kiritimatiellia bacterium]
MKKTIAACVLALAASAFASETRMLFLGNSITWHQYYPSIGWEHEWGMAASEESKDWVHLFAGGYGQATDTAPVMRVRNIADFERGWDSFDVENDADLALDVAFAPDIVIVAIGENVPDVSSSQAAFNAKFKALCEKFPSVISSGKFLIRAPFWNNPTLDAIMLEVAEELGTLYVDSSVCDTPANRAGEYASVNGGIAAHPGDSGMAAMAAQMLLAYGIGEAESSGDEEETGSEESGATSPAVVVTRAGEYAAADGIGEAVSGAPAAGGSSIRRLSNGEYVHVFASSGTFRAPASCAIDIQYLAVGGGGGGGALMGGGGGAGAVVTGSYLLPAGETIAISVGIGGAG